MAIESHYDHTEIIQPSLPFIKANITNSELYDKHLIPETYFGKNKQINLTG